jgi:putative Mg2+ transporter-C (MgtC) family protein
MTDWTTTLGEVVRHEFSDVPDLRALATLLLRLLLAAGLAGVLGWDRERRGAPAGLRTHMLVGVGSALFMLVPQQAGVSPDGLTRVAQGVVAGIGFLGAGAIMKMDHDRGVHGLTTAASIWATAAIGIAAGLGRGLTALLATLLAWLILGGLLWAERRFGLHRRQAD